MQIISVSHGYLEAGQCECAGRLGICTSGWESGSSSEA